MEDIFQWCREGNALQVRVWLDDTEHDMNQGDEHGFSPLHWACKEGHAKIAELLVRRGARVAATNLGDDTPLHLAAAHGHRSILHMLLSHRVDVNFPNAHGNTPLHYACFWGYGAVAEQLVLAGALVALANKDGDTPLDKARGHLVQRLHELAVQQGQELKKIQYKDQSWLGMKTRSRDATLSRHKGIDINDLALHTRIAVTPTGETWRGRWQKIDIVAKILALRECSPRVQRDFSAQFPKLRIFSHPNVLPVVGCCVSAPSLVVISQYMAWGSLHSLIHGAGAGGAGAGGAGAGGAGAGGAGAGAAGAGTQRLVLDAGAGARLAHGVARGMHYLHSLRPHHNLPPLTLTSKHVMIDEELTARINMADASFSFSSRREYCPAWRAPEALLKPREALNLEAADMWSFAVLLWELATREIPFAELSPMECGMRIALEGLRLVLPPGASPHVAKLVTICMHDDPAKRPTFDMILPILEKMKR